MLTQLKKLAQECDDRYASDTELKFLTDYLEEIDQRINTYDKIRNIENKLIEQIDIKAKSVDPNAFDKCGKDVSSICERDRKHTMRFLATAMLFNEPDKLRNTLLWQSIIMRAFKDENSSKLTYEIMAEVMNEEFNDEEVKLVNPVLQLVQMMLN
ncbi:globin family protein [Crocosphaera chwakensis]|uniref:Allophycocyanin alpha subunit n=1 Tax=Crocosphaera chwakensis CCY0110 TaxID=391612 RepID=A3IQL6_9CHRO|nr:allophycocyanin subunit alpha [Crocosphaera chwakensis]EAZ91291.1 allophycocyanin alpha subunit [Crocosphaera chwakensis CCY0110]